MIKKTAKRIRAKKGFTQEQINKIAPMAQVPKVAEETKAVKPPNWLSLNDLTSGGLYVMKTFIGQRGIYEHNVVHVERIDFGKGFFNRVIGAVHEAISEQSRFQKIKE
jgi:hypothetical protein